jgi:hypothetical protein
VAAQHATCVTSIWRETDKPDFFKFLCGFLNYAKPYPHDNNHDNGGNDDNGKSYVCLSGVVTLWYCERTESVLWFSDLNYEYLSHEPHACYVFCLSHYSNMFTIIISGKEYKLWSSSLCNFLRSPLTSALSQLEVFSWAHSSPANCVPTWGTSWSFTPI